MKKFLIIFIASIFFFAFVISTCNGDDYDDEYSQKEPTSAISFNSEESLSIEEPSLQEQNQTDIISATLEIPRLTKTMPEQLLCRTGYTTSYNNKTKNANWVAWHLKKEHTTGPWTRRGISFMVDDDVKGARQELEDWDDLKLPLDHGHLCPAGDNKWKQEAMMQTFLLTNICPQNSALNRGDWEELERRCRGWANLYGDIYIVAGPLFYNQNYKTIGKNKVGIPDAFFKVVLRMTKKPQTIGFIYPNDGVHHKMNHYVCSVDDVEEQTGIDFFYNLDDEIENSIERQADLSKW